MEPEDEGDSEDLTALTDEELEQELTIAVGNEHRDDRYQALLAELERRRTT